jgi:hypothetical protein
LLKGVVLEVNKLADIEAKWGPPAKVEQTSDGVIWYYNYYKPESGWWLGSIIADKEGNVIKVSTYWEQPDSLEVNRKSKVSGLHF